MADGRHIEHRFSAILLSQAVFSG